MDLPQTSQGAIGGQQFIAVALLSYLPIVEHDHVIAFAQTGESMGDHNQRPIDRKFINGLQDLCFGDIIQR